MTFLKKLILYIGCCALPDIVTSLPGVFMWAFWGERWRIVKMNNTWAFAFNLKKDSWPKRTWYAKWGGTCFGRCIMLSDDDHALEHEFYHVEQYEAGCVFGAGMTLVAGPAYGLLGPIIFPAVMWCLSSFIFTGCAMLAAWLRGEPAYRGSHREKAAYGLVELHERILRGS